MLHVLFLNKVREPVVISPDWRFLGSQLIVSCKHLQGSLCTSWRTFNGCQWRVVFCDAQKGRWFNEEFLGRWLICASCCCTDAMLFHVVPLLPEVHLRWHSMICPWPCDDPVYSVQFIKTTSDQEAWLTQNCMIHGTGIFVCEIPWQFQYPPVN